MSQTVEVQPSPEAVERSLARGNTIVRSVMHKGKTIHIVEATPGNSGAMILQRLPARGRKGNPSKIHEICASNTSEHLTSVAHKFSNL